MLASLRAKSRNVRPRRRLRRRERIRPNRRRCITPGTADLSSCSAWQHSCGNQYSDRPSTSSGTRREIWPRSYARQSCPEGGRNEIHCPRSRLKSGPPSDSTTGRSVSACSGADDLSNCARLLVTSNRYRAEPRQVFSVLGSRRSTPGASRIGQS